MYGICFVKFLIWESFSGEILPWHLLVPLGKQFGFLKKTISVTLCSVFDYCGIVSPLNTYWHLEFIGVFMYHYETDTDYLDSEK